MESYAERDFVEIGINTHFVQDNHSKSGKGVLRGLHFQRQHPKTLTALCSPSYFQSSLQCLINKKTADVVYATSDTVCQSDAIKLSDGSIVYSVDYMSRSVLGQDVFDAINYGGGDRFVPSGKSCLNRLLVIW